MSLEKIVIPTEETDEEKQARLAAEEEARKAAETAKAAEEAARKAEEEARKKALEEAEEIEIDGVVYKLNENGDAVDENGDIKFNKETIDKMSEEQPQGDYFEAISKVTGIDVVDENGKPVTFEPTVEGFAQREIAVKKLGEQEGFNKGFTEFLTKNPDIADIINYKNQYGTIEGYSNHIDYAKLSVGDDEDQMADFIYKAEIQKGTSPDRAKRMVEFAKMNNTLKEDAIESLEWLRKAQSAEQDSIRKQQEVAKQEAEEAYISFYGVSYEQDGKMVVHDAPNSLYDMVINKGIIGNYSIPKEGIKVQTDKGLKLISRAELFNYFAAPVKEINGYLYSQAQLDEMKKMESPAELALRFMTNIAGGMEQLVDATITQRQIKEIRKFSTKGGKTTTTRKTTTGGADDRIVLKI